MGRVSRRRGIEQVGRGNPPKLLIGRDVEELAGVEQEP
jgi:hypothetical protein